MNVVYNNSIVTLRNEQGFYYYYCDHFHRIFISKKSANGNVCLEKKVRLLFVIADVRTFLVLYFFV